MSSMEFDLNLPSAWVIFENKIYFSSHRVMENAPLDTPIFRLVAGLQVLFGVNSYRPLRLHLNLNYKPTLFCKSVVKVCAKRMRHIENIPSIHLDSFDLVEVGFLGLNRINDLAQEQNKKFNYLRNKKLNSTAEIAKELKLMLEIESEKIPLFEKNRNVSCIIENHQKRIFAHSHNQSKFLKIAHAELLAAWQYQSEFENKFDQNTNIYCALKPCRMCAAALWQMSSHWQSLRVSYLEFDEGPMARSTILNANSADRQLEIGNKWTDFGEELEFKME